MHYYQTPEITAFPFSFTSIDPFHKKLGHWPSLFSLFSHPTFSLFVLRKQIFLKDLENTNLCCETKFFARLQINTRFVGESLATTLLSYRSTMQIALGARACNRIQDSSHPIETLFQIRFYHL